ncbi:hypothetical protein G3N55_00020 [Dissulfurirhabdus thermomarina]|uniref:Holin n=1 Tax=Dissulfurirhabdus thermomarina TaxID=1765737 RepID=A0A6N9TJ02_DISTH|nr:hypothetical protein [Dissulfurirhabdus thermomarina]NDY41235.1 hypothetical protein [Dissulfurirhabdus thermomarina]
MNSGKQWWMSRTLWTNVLAIVAIILQGQFGYVLSPETQVMVLGAVNALLRLVTRQPIAWEDHA